MAASQHGHAECVQMLVDRNADVAMRKTSGETALSLAEENARFNVARILRGVLNMRLPPDPNNDLSIDSYPNGRTMRLQQQQRRQQGGGGGGGGATPREGGTPRRGVSPPQRPQSAPQQTGS